MKGHKLAETFSLNSSAQADRELQHFGDPSHWVTMGYVNQICANLRDSFLLQRSVQIS